MKHYPMRQRVLGQVVADKAALHGDRVFMRFEQRSISYRELDLLSNRIANGLAQLGVGKSTPVALLMDNKPEIILVYIALGKLGAVSVPLNTAAKGEQLAYYLSQSNSELVIADADLVERLVPAAPRATTLKGVVSLAEGGVAGRVAGLALPQTDFGALLQAPPTPPEAEVRFCDLHCIVYTSGTTGPSKGNSWIHANILTLPLMLAEINDYQPEDVLYVCLPLFHGNAWLTSVLPALVADASVVIARRFSASLFWDDIRRYGVTQFNALGAMLNFIWGQPPAAGDREHAVRRVLTIPTPPFYHEFEQRFGVKLSSMYGLGDFGVITVCRPSDPPQKWASSGRPCDGIEVRIVDDDDFDLPRGQSGEIVARANEPWLATQGYYNLPEATVKATRNLWFHTGDRGYLDEDGYLYFVDRKKDAIRRRGENISSFEVEQVILKHPAVLDVAAFPVSSEHGEEEVMVSVVLGAGQTLSEAALIAHCAADMAYFMVPRYVQFVAALPRTLTEKVEKFRLRADAEQRLAQIWDRERAGIALQR